MIENEKGSIKKERETGIDIVRIVAVFFVICVHFYWNNGYYKVDLSGFNLQFLTFMRWIFYGSVPLFLILTGYLLNRKKLSLHYYKGIIRILFIYVIASFACIYYKNHFDGYKIGLKDSVKSIFNFSGAPYAWYINMYIGLFLMIPFLNILYNALKNKKEKLLLIGTLIVVISLPPLINIKTQILPNWWNNIYPLLYYFIGAYIWEYKIKLNKWICLAGVAASGVISTVITFKQSKGGVFETGIDNYNAITNVIIAVLLFLIIYDIKIKNMAVKVILKWLSEISLGIYLVSWIFERYIYKKWLGQIFNVQEKFIFFICSVGTIFIASCILSSAINILYKCIVVLWGESEQHENN